MKTKSNKPQVVINLEHDLHRLLKKAATVEGRTMRLQATHILRSKLAPLLSSAVADLPPQRPRK
jgi:hypothetical protein